MSKLKQDELSEDYFRPSNNAKKIKKAMNRLNLTQKELAIKINTYQPEISDWINGKSIPQGGNKENLEKELSINLD